MVKKVAPQTPLPKTPAFRGPLLFDIHANMPIRGFVLNSYFLVTIQPKVKIAIMKIKAIKINLGGAFLVKKVAPQAPLPKT